MLYLNKILLLGLVFGGAILFTGWMRNYALKSHLLDTPNARSSHIVPTPRGGGLAIVLAFLLAMTYLVLIGQLASRLYFAFAGSGIVAIIGYWDDWHDLAARVRLLGHFFAACWAAFWLGGLPSLDLGFVVWDLGWAGYMICVISLVWLLNLYNFMDGIDGLAGSEAVFVAGGGGLFLFWAGAGSLAWVCWLLAAACLGFLLWNWPPAKIFMGDVGSGFLGFMLGVLAIASAHIEPILLWLWIILLGVFIVDATVTLLRRLLCGENVFQAHRSHAYQHATMLAGNHLTVTLGIVGLNLLILLPLAFVAWVYPALVLPMVAAAGIILIGLALYLQAGIPTAIESPESKVPGA